MSTVLFVDAGGPVENRMLVGVCHGDGELVRWDRVELTEPMASDTSPSGRDIRRAELLAILLAARYAAAARDGLTRLGLGPLVPKFVEGVILSDCRDSVAALARGGPRPPRAYKTSHWRGIVDEIQDVLPERWRVAWIPRSVNLANAALRRMPAEPERRVDAA